ARLAHDRFAFLRPACSHSQVDIKPPKCDVAHRRHSCALCLYRLCALLLSPDHTCVRSAGTLRDSGIRLLKLNCPVAHITVWRLQCATSTANGRKAEEVRNCSTDEGRPLGTGLQEQVPNHLRRLCPKDKVVNAEGKGLELLGQVTGKK